MFPSYIDWLQKKLDLPSNSADYLIIETFTDLSVHKFIYWVEKLKYLIKKGLGF